MNSTKATPPPDFWFEPFSETSPVSTIEAAVGSRAARTAAGCVILAWLVGVSIVQVWLVRKVRTLERTARPHEDDDGPKPDCAEED